jgi:hypothetical protein
LGPLELLCQSMRGSMCAVGGTVWDWQRSKSLETILVGICWHFFYSDMNYEILTINCETWAILWYSVIHPCPKLNAPWESAGSKSSKGAEDRYFIELRTVWQFVHNSFTPFWSLNPPICKAAAEIHSERLWKMRAAKELNLLRGSVSVCVQILKRKKQCCTRHSEHWTTWNDRQPGTWT